MDQLSRYKVSSYLTFAFSIFAILFAYILEKFGIVPCRLCIYQRFIYYVMLFIIAINFILISRCFHKIIKISNIVIPVLIIAGIGLSAFQVLIENGVIEYDSSCTASFKNVNSPEEFLSSLNAKDLVACDKPQLVVLGISLAGWNGLYMLLMLSINILILYKKEIPIRKFLKNDTR